MLRIDSHQHFWIFDEVRDSWINDSMDVLRGDFLPDQLQPVLEEHRFDGCVVVQSDQSEAENSFQLKNADDHSFIKGVVGWVDLQSDDVSDRLEELSKHPKLKGFRHILQGEADRALMLKSSFLKGISALQKFGFTYDILILPDQLKYAEDLVSRFPDQLFVVDHLAKPDIKNKNITDWSAGIKQLAKHENVSCKVSGMVTEADWQNWKPGDFTPYLDVVFEAFGSKRVMYGSDWPVSLLAGTYGQVVSLMEGYVSKLSPNEQGFYWGGNATEFYKLK